MNFFESILFWRKQVSTFFLCRICEVIFHVILIRMQRRCPKRGIWLLSTQPARVTQSDFSMQKIDRHFKNQAVAIPSQASCHFPKCFAQVVDNNGLRKRCLILSTCSIFYLIFCLHGYIYILSRSYLNNKCFWIFQGIQREVQAHIKSLE